MQDLPRVRKIRSSWMLGYQAVRQYLETGAGWPTRDVSFRKIRIGRWCENQRNRRGSLTEEQLQLLNSLGFVWKRRDPFLENFESLVRFRRENPDKWPQQNGSPEETTLGRWLSKQQGRARANTLETYQKKLLTSLETPFEKEWDRNFKLLEDYVSKRGCFPAQDEKFKNLNIGQWCTNQRLLRRQKKLSKLRVAKLNSLKFIWEPYQAEWLVFYNALIRFREQFPQTWPKSTDRYLGLKLGNWCVRQRVLGRSKQIKALNRRLLKKLDFPWAVEGSIYTLPDLTGLKFNRLLVKRLGSTTKDGKRTWICLCECGRNCSVIGSALTSGKQKSCGCLLRQKASARMHLVQKKSSEARLQTAEEVQERINKVHGAAVIVLHRDTYKNVFELATLEHELYGEWRARPITVYRGASHPADGRARTTSAMEARKLTEEDINSRLPPHVKIRPGTFQASSKKAEFIDIEYGVWSAIVSNVLSGSRHPERGNRARVENAERTNLKRYGRKYTSQVLEFQQKAMKKQARVYRKRHWKTKQILLCRGLWEVAVVDYLNRNKEEYLWQPRVFEIPPSVMRTPAGNATTYCPDLFLVSESKWIEIKGYFREDAMKKWAWFVEQNPTAELWDLRRLKELKILKR